MEFLDEAGAAKALQTLFANASRAKIAVAFWGNEAVEKLGLNRSGLKLSVICNLDSGACNPIEIRKLMTLCDKGEVRSLPSLHAKVYWTPEGVLLGSSNASSNGLAVEGAPNKSWVEANMLIRDPAIIATIGQWFERQLPDSYEIEDSHLMLAAEVWKKRKRAAPTATRLTSDLLEAFRRAPNSSEWAKVRVIFWSEPLSAKGKKEEEREREQRPVLEGYDCYEDWKDIEAGEQIVEFKVQSRNGKFTGYFKSPAEKLESKSLVFVRRVPGIKLPFRPNLRLSDTDMTFVRDNIRAILKHFETWKEEYARVDLQSFVGAIDAVKASIEPVYSEDDANFKALLEQTASIGQKFKLPMTGFKGMLRKLGGLGTARRLLEGRTEQKGLAGLYFKELMDISVEAILLRPEWHHEFTPKELDVARQRLKAGHLAVERDGTLMKILPGGTLERYKSARDRLR
ncbi:hypothetical protein [Asticcacaulis sp. W401b]|uniref:hypothetical protein n=1 Tax=Asticcacaulis sp. W401b TaxID=3388666 RepID=UPI003970D1B9